MLYLNISMSVTFFCLKHFLIEKLSEIILDSLVIFITLFPKSTISGFD